MGISLSAHLAIGDVPQNLSSQKGKNQGPACLGRPRVVGLEAILKQNN